MTKLIFKYQWDQMKLMTLNNNNNYKFPKILIEIILIKFYKILIKILTKIKNNKNRRNK